VRAHSLEKSASLRREALSAGLGRRSPPKMT
jgi:hypothetical protein